MFRKINFKIITKICDSIFKENKLIHINTINYNLYEGKLIQLFSTSRKIFFFCKFKVILPSKN